MSADDFMARIEQARNSLESARQLVSQAQEILGIRDEPPPQEPEERGFFDKAWGAIGDHAHTGLDLAGFLPVVGTAADLANAGLYAAEGDYVNAGLSAASAIPIAGDAAAAARLGARGMDAVRNVGDEAVGAADEVLGVADEVVDAPRVGDNVKPFGGGGPPSSPNAGDVYSERARRWYNPEQSGGPILPLSTDRIQIKPGGIDAIERHVARFGSERGNEVQVQRLRDILDPNKPEVVATQQDINYYAHELRESVRYRKEGFPSDGEQVLPDDSNAAEQLWENTHTATLEDLKHTGHPEELHHPDALAARQEQMEEQYFPRKGKLP